MWVCQTRKCQEVSKIKLKNILAWLIPFCTATSCKWVKVRIIKVAESHYLCQGASELHQCTIYLQLASSVLVSIGNIAKVQYFLVLSTLVCWCISLGHWYMYCLSANYDHFPSNSLHFLTQNYLQRDNTYTSELVKYTSVLMYLLPKSSVMFQYLQYYLEVCK